uniref:Uncharacterized protein n=1 Tax=Arundo donax TaxID=35708 RepID=A0A0A8ZCF9_ARUDO
MENIIKRITRFDHETKM